MDNLEYIEVDEPAGLLRGIVPTRSVSEGRGA